MRPADILLANELDRKLTDFQHEINNLPGIHTNDAKECLILQLIDSIRRVKYAVVVGERNFDGQCANALADCFNPINAASWNFQNNNIDEAVWLVFLSTHFGKHERHGWRLLKGFYSGLGTSSSKWNWRALVDDFAAFENWYINNESDLSELGGFSNHRKFQSLRSDAKSGGTLTTISSYLEWVESETHVEKFEDIQIEVGNDPEALFSALYKSTRRINGFGRLGRFDFLTMIGKLGILDIIPGSTFLQGASGPFDGTKLLFTNDVSAAMTRKEAETLLNEIARYFDLDFGMQVFEDAICNWQKDPIGYQRY